MFLEIKVTAESSAALCTDKGFLSSMGVHVEGQIVGLVEALPTEGTFVFSLGAVCQFMVFVVALLVKTLAADLTGIRFHP